MSCDGDLYRERCDELGRTARCPACVQLPVGVYLRRRPRTGFRYVGWLHDGGATPALGLLVCNACGYLLVAPRGAACAVDPPQGLVREIMRTRAGGMLAACMKAIRLDVGPPILVSVGSKG